MKKMWGIALLLIVALVFANGCAKKKSNVAKSTGPGLQSVHFDFDKSNIKPEYEPVLQANAQWMQDNSRVKITIAGNCDQRGSAEYNIALGDRRARSAKSYLRNLGVSSSRMQTVSYGKERPVCTGQGENCWWRNRRDDFVVR